MIILGYKTGQLGNRLFVYANFIANSIKCGYGVVNPSFDEYGKYFKNIHRNSMAVYPHRKIFGKDNTFFRKAILLICKITFKCMHLLKIKCVGNAWIKFFILHPEESMNLAETEFSKIKDSTKLLVVQGWLFRDSESFNENADTIRSYFNICEEYEKHIHSLMMKAKRLGNVVIGMHMRKGDYKNFLNGKFFYSLEEYKSVMKGIESIFEAEKVCWLLCSDENIDSNQFEDFIFIKGNNHIIEDMYSFAKCDYIVGPPSTYTGWASFYGETPLYHIREINRKISLDDFFVVGG